MFSDLQPVVHDLTPRSAANRRLAPRCSWSSRYRIYQSPQPCDRASNFWDLPADLSHSLHVALRQGDANPSKTHPCPRPSWWSCLQCGPEEFATNSKQRHRQATRHKLETLRPCLRREITSEQPNSLALLS